MEKKEKYVLHGGDQGAKRLDILGRVFWPSTELFLNKIPWPTHCKILDAGCGTGQTANRLPTFSTKISNIVGIDADARAIEIANSSKTTSKITYEKHNVFEIPFKDEFDVTYSRFLLSHLPDPVKAIQNLAKATKPGGLIAIEEINFAAHFCVPPNKAFDTYVDSYQEVVKHNGGNANLGIALPQILNDLGFAAIDLFVTQPTFLHGEGKVMAAITMEHVAPRLLEAGICTQDTIEETISELRKLATDNTTLMSVPRLFQVTARVAN